MTVVVFSCNKSSGGSQTTENNVLGVRILNIRNEGCADKKNKGRCGVK